MESQHFFNENNKENTDIQVPIKFSTKNVGNNENSTKTKSLTAINISKMIDTDSE
jgi:hypothetical protein